MTDSTALRSPVVRTSDIRISAVISRAAVITAAVILVIFAISAIAVIAVITASAYRLGAYAPLRQLRARARKAITAKIPVRAKCGVNYHEHLPLSPGISAEKTVRQPARCESETGQMFSDNTYGCGIKKAGHGAAVLLGVSDKIVCARDEPFGFYALDHNSLTNPSRSSKSIKTTRNERSIGHLLQKSTLKSSRLTGAMTGSVIP